MGLNEFNSFIKRWGIFSTFPDLYDSISGMNSYGPYGTAIRNNIVEAMRKEFRKLGFWEVDCPVVSPEVVWKASGHMDRFVDVIAHSDGRTFRIEKVIEEERPDLTLTEKGLVGLQQLLEKEKIIPKGCSEPLSNAEEYNLMLLTIVAGSNAVLRPETATTTYLGFRDYHKLFRGAMPLKIFQYGRAFRNEITSRQGLIRGREFEQFEGQIFIFEDQKQHFDNFDKLSNLEVSILDQELQQTRGSAKKLSLREAVSSGVYKSEAFAYCFGIVANILKKIGINQKSITFRQHLPDEMAHYAIDAWDAEVMTEQYGLVEVCGVHDRGNYDLSRHQEYSGKKLEVPNPNGGREVPHILEIAFGVGRSVYCALEHNFSSRDGKNVLYLPKRISPVHVAVFPLVNKEGLDIIADELNVKLVEEGFISVFDKKGSIGKRYARMDEIGTPYCVTVDFQTKEDNTVTIRDRDTTQQERVLIDNLTTRLYDGVLRK